MKRLGLAAALLAAALMVTPAFAGGKGRSGGARSAGRSHSSRGYYRGPRQPSGAYRNGQGSSHRGGSYSNKNTGDRYQKSPKK
jgi:hypothetical protein